MADVKVPELSPSVLHAKREGGDPCALLDVREQNEWNLFRIHGAIHLPLAKVSEGAREALARFPGQEVIVYCGRGPRSVQAVEMLRAQGYRASSLAGGIAAWIDAGFEVDD
jgi:sulfur-carrier protein adenylyltransferase/sulfurtransferase